MKTYLECIPCFFQQALKAARLISDDPVLHERIMRDLLQKISAIDLNQPPPAMGRIVYQRVRELSGHPDPYKEIKKKFNRFVQDLYPEFQKRIFAATHPFDMAVRMAVAGNIIDFGINARITPETLLETVEQAICQPLEGNIKGFEQAVQTAKKILYLGDNAGEIVFDRLLMEQMPLEKITYAVRGAPIINDVTREDAADTGVTDLVRVIDNGADAPGTLLEICSNEFRDAFDTADVIISKGQGNYESLSDADKEIFFIFMVKCPVVATSSGYPEKSIVLLHKSKTPGPKDQAVVNP